MPFVYVSHLSTVAFMSCAVQRWLIITVRGQPFVKNLSMHEQSAFSTLLCMPLQRMLDWAVRAML